MDVMLVFPRSSGYMFSGNPPLGIAYIAAVLRRDGFDTGITDIGIDFLDDKKGFVSFLKEKRPKIIGFSVLTEQYPYARELITEIKHEMPDVKIVAGGPHVTLKKGKLLAETPGIDFLVYGEGEMTMLELSRHLLKGKGDLSGIDGIIYRKNGIVTNKPRQLISDLDGLPLPARDMLKMSDYRGSLTILTSRGCPYQCIYCSSHLWLGRGWRSRSPESVISELEMLLSTYPEEFKKRPLTILDDAFNINMDRAKKICDMMIERELKFTWVCATGLRANLVDRELLEKMKRAGCAMINYGIESTDDSVLEKIKKGEKLEEIRNAIRLTKEIGITVGGYFILDLPGMNMQKAKEMAKTMKELDLDKIVLNMVAPYEGTELWDYVHTPGVKILRDLDIPLWDSPNFETVEFTAAEKMEAFKYLCRVRNRIMLKNTLRPGRLIPGLMRTRTKAEFIRKTKHLFMLAFERKARNF